MKPHEPKNRDNKENMFPVKKMEANPFLQAPNPDMIFEQIVNKQTLLC
jgi:hypothetical protein